MKSVRQWLQSSVGAVLAAVSLTLIVSLLSYAAVTQISGLAVAQTNTRWNNVKDAAVGNGQTTGILLTTPCLWNGASCNRAAGTATGSAIVEQAQVGGAFFAVKRDNITTSSANVAFGLTSRKVLLVFPDTNTDEMCVDWVGGTAVCPAANTSGDARFQPGTSILLDDFAQTSLSFIANSGTQTVFIQAWF